MRRTTLITLFGLAAIMTACMQSPEGDIATTGDAFTIDRETRGIPLSIDTSASYIEWLGTKPGGNHYGTLSIKQGTIYTHEGEITGGTVILDMTSIKVDDIKNPGTNQALVNHLLSNDFFHVDSFPTGYFDIAQVAPLTNAPPESNSTHSVTGNLTLKGITKGINFTTNIEVADNRLHAKTPQFVLDRTNWNVNYGSRSVFANLKDNFIHDEMAMKIHLVAKNE